MGQNTLEEEPTAYEPVPVPDTFVTGMLPIEDAGGLFRVTLFADRRDGSGSLERTIVARLVLGRATFDECLALSLKAGKAPPTERLMVTH